MSTWRQVHFCEEKQLWVEREGKSSLVLLPISLHKAEIKLYIDPMINASRWWQSIGTRAMIEILNYTWRRTPILTVNIAIITQRSVGWEKNPVSTYLLTQISLNFIVLHTLAPTSDRIELKILRDIAGQTADLPIAPYKWRNTASNIATYSIDNFPLVDTLTFPINRRRIEEYSIALLTYLNPLNNNKINTPFNSITISSQRLSLKT